VGGVRTFVCKNFSFRLRCHDKYVCCVKLVSVGSRNGSKRKERVEKKKHVGLDRKLQYYINVYAVQELDRQIQS